MGSSPKQVLAGFECQPRGCESGTGFGLGLSPSLWRAESIESDVTEQLD